LINVNHSKERFSGYGIAGGNIYNIVKSGFKNASSNKNLSRGINIFVSIPPFKINKGSYNIGFFYWETIGFPDSWVSEILKLDEFWSSCDLITKNLKMIGFKGKIVNMPTPIEKRYSFEKTIFGDAKGEVVGDDSFKFYSIFHWNYRKGYDVLIKAYLSEFSDEDVCLIVKTHNKKKSVLKHFSEIVSREKKALGKANYPKIFFTEGIMNYSDILRIHSSCDCFVLPHRGEGWGIPMHEAISNCNPVIATKFGGITDYFDSSNSYVVDHKMIKSKNMNWTNLYDDRMWAEPSCPSLMREMRSAFENEEMFRSKQVLSKVLSDKISYENISKKIQKRIRELQ